MDRPETDPATESVSICIPAFNAAPYIGAALDSVIADVPPETQIIVADDGSTDDTPAIVERFAPRVRLVRGPRAGVAAAFSAAVSASRGDLIASFDADDLWVRGRFAAQTAALASDPSLDAVFGHCREFVSPELSLEDQTRWRCTTEPQPFIARSTMMIRRAAWERHGGRLPAGFRVAEFIAWYEHAADEGLRGRVVPELIHERRIHRANIAHAGQANRDEYLRIVQARLARRRSAARNAT